MTRLLDVSVLLALVDPAHIHHNRAHAWLDSQRNSFRWATCAITENGFCRIMSSASYPGNTQAGVVVRILDELKDGLAVHDFWHCELSVTDRRHFDLELVQGSKQLTDIYLLALAVEHNGVFATFDRRMRTTHVIGASEKYLEVL